MSGYQGQPPAGQWQQPGPGAGQPQAQPPPPKKSRKGLIIGCCSGCGLVMLLLCGFGGWLFYMEEGREQGEPGDEVASAAIGPGVFEVTFTPEGRGYASYDMWLEVTGQKDPTASLIELGGESTCTGGGAYASPNPISVQIDQYSWAVKRYQETGTLRQFTAWIKIDDEYLANGLGTVTCRGSLRTAGWQMLQGRVVVTKFQRPSDWLG